MEQKYLYLQVILYRSSNPSKYSLRGVQFRILEWYIFSGQGGNSNYDNSKVDYSDYKAFLIVLN